MTRIIAGFAGSIPLKTPGGGTRPTSDRVREAIFSALEAREAIAGARVLDLYAGSGALGLESASRGASQVVLVDSAAAAVSACRTNAALVLKQAPAHTSVEVVGKAVRNYLSGASGPWDLVFLDPPYDLDDSELQDDLVALAPLLAEDAVVLIERSSRSPEPRWPATITVDRRKNYGDTTLWWAERS